MKEMPKNKETERKIVHLPEIEFRIMIVNMFLRCENRVEKMREAINPVNTITKNTEEIKNEQTEMSNKITEI